MPTIQGGVEVKLPHRMSWYTEAGIKYLNIYKPDTSFIGSGGFKIKTEIRYYLLPSKDIVGIIYRLKKMGSM